MTTGTIPQDVKAYLDAVRARLDDLPAEERDDLLADVEPSILDSTEESDAPVEVRLGPPDSFADELRAAAGLPPRTETVDSATKRGLRERIAAADAFFTTSPTTRWLRELAPLWWALRGLVIVGLLELLSSKSVFDGPDSYVLLMTLAAVLAVTASVAVGLRRPRRGAALVAVNLVLALATVPVISSVISDGRDAVRNNGIVTVVPTEVAPPGLVYNGAPVQNIYAFDRQGRLLQDVRLFAQDGQPLEIAADPTDPNRRTVKSRAGNLAFNAFPIRYFEPGTKRVANPAAGTPVHPSPLVTKPLGTP
jgi:hypothetical protein